MDPNELNSCKVKLSSDILNLVNNFEKATGLKIDSIDLIHALVFSNVDNHNIRCASIEITAVL